MNKGNHGLIENANLVLLIKTLTVVFLSSIFLQSSLCTNYATVNLSQIQFNYEEGHTNDAIKITENKNDSINDPEWRGHLFTDLFAYFIGQSNRKIKVKFTTACDVHMFISISSSGGGIGETCEFFVANYESGDWVTINLEGSVPSSVGKRTIIWSWEISTISLNPSYCSKSSTTFSTDHSYYTLFAAPQAPMEVPWTDVIDLVFDMTGYESSVSSAAEEIVEGIYNNSGFLYDVELELNDSKYTTHGDYDFNLTTMLNNYGPMQI